MFPGSTEEVSAVLQVCANHGVPVVPRGAGTGYSGGAVPRGGGVVVCLTRMNAVLGFEPEAMRIHVEAGMVTAAVHRRALDSGLYYPPDPGSSSTCTIGGNVACNSAGPHTLRYGTTGTRWFAHTWRTAETSSVEPGNTTAPGRCRSPDAPKASYP